MTHIWISDKVNNNGERKGEQSLINTAVDGAQPSTSGITSKYSAASTSKVTSQPFSFTGKFPNTLQSGARPFCCAHFLFTFH